MFYCGADVHSKSTYLVVLDGKGREVFSGAVATERKALLEALKPYEKKGVKVIQETGSSMAFIQSVFEGTGAEVVTVHASAMKVITASKKKTDKRDAYHLAWASYKDALPEPVYVPTSSEQELRQLLSAQQRIRKGRTGVSNGVRGQLKGLGVVLPLRALTKHQGWEELMERGLAPAIDLIVRESYGVWEVQTRALEAVERAIAERTKGDELVKRIKTIPYVGEACAAAVRAYLGDLDRFHGRKSVVSYAGFNPSQRDSGARQVRGHLTRQGPSRLRSVFVQAAHCLIGKGFKGHPGWKAWYERLLHRRGHRHIAVVAVARRLYALAYQVGRSGQVYKASLSGSVT